MVNLFQHFIHIMLSKITSICYVCPAIIGTVCGVVFMHDTVSTQGFHEGDGSGSARTLLQTVSEMVHGSVRLGNGRIMSELA